MVACGDDGGAAAIDSGTPDTSSGAADASIDGTPSITVVVSGQAVERDTSGASPVENVLIGAYALGDEATPLVTATTDAEGKFSLTIESSGPFDGYLKATKTGYVETYLFPPAPLAADFEMASIDMLTPEAYGGLYTLTVVQEEADTAVIALSVIDGTGPVAGATVSSDPASTYRYNGAGGVPSASASSTASDGVAYMLDVTPGNVIVSASTSESTFQAHDVKTWAGQLTMTLIVP